VTPRFSVLTPVYDTQPDHLDACVGSVLAQTFDDWELVLVDDASPGFHIAPQLRRLAALDPRIRVVTRAANGGIVAASSDALDVAAGEFVALLDHDDLLAPDALATMDALLAARPLVDLAYSDEDKVSETGRHYDVFHKPDWSPIRLTNQMYVGHLLVIRRSLAVEVGGFRPEYEGSQDYDLVLRVSERAREVGHIPAVLYHWRATSTSTALTTAVKPYATVAGRSAVADHFRRRGVAAEVDRVEDTGIYRVIRTIDPEPLVSIVIPSRGSAALIDGRFRTMVTGAVRSVVSRTTYRNYEIVAVLDRSTPPGVVTDLEQLAGDRLRVVWFDRPFNFSEKVNAGVLESTGEYVLLLNDDTEVISPGWIEAMMGLALEPGVAMVGAKLYFADGTVQHGGHRYHAKQAGHVGFGQPHDSPGIFGALLVEREASGVTAACALVRRDVYLQVGGFTLELPGNFNDVDFSMKVTFAGHRIAWTPHAQLFHYESKTRTTTVHAWEVHTMHRRWSARMRVDPYYWDGPAELRGDEYASVFDAFDTF
jgi:GT2 family glycosyltransferase